MSCKGIRKDTHTHMHTLLCIRRHTNIHFYLYNDDLNNKLVQEITATFIPALRLSSYSASLQISLHFSCIWVIVSRYHLLLLCFNDIYYLSDVTFYVSFWLFTQINTFIDLFIYTLSSLNIVYHTL